MRNYFLLLALIPLLLAAVALITAWVMHRNLGHRVFITHDRDTQKKRFRTHT